MTVTLVVDVGLDTEVLDVVERLYGEARALPTEIACTTAVVIMREDYT